MSNGDKVSVEEDGHVQEMDIGDGCITMSVCLMALNTIFMQCIFYHAL